MLEGSSNIKKILENITYVFWIFLFAFIIASLILFIVGTPPLTAFKLLFIGSLGSWIKIVQVITAWIPLTLCAIGLIYTFKVGLWNIGVEGQIMAGAVFTTLILRMEMAKEAPVLFLSLSFIAGMIGGALWAILAGYLKTKGGINEIFAGLGLNFVAQGVILWLIFGPWKRPGIASMSGTTPFAYKLWLPTISQYRVPIIGLSITIIGLFVTIWIINHTRLGLGLKSIGNNPKASYLHGLKPNLYMIVAMGLAGGFSGLAGTFQVTGVYHRLIPSISSNYGYLALLVVMLANYRISLTPAIAFFFVCLNVGSIQLPMMLQVDSSMSGIIQGTLVLVTLLMEAIRRKGIKRLSIIKID